MGIHLYLQIEKSCCYVLSWRFRKLPGRGWSGRSGLLENPVGGRLTGQRGTGSYLEREGDRRAE